MSREKPRAMIRLGNMHLGNLIHTFSLPARSTCPGATFACLLVCYAIAFGRYARSGMKLHEHNRHRADNLPTFQRDMVNELRGQYARVLRILVGGDFFSAAYVRCWTRICRACPGVTFLAYTRSWTVKEMVRPLVELAGLPNVYLFWSEDRDTGPCHLPHGRRCFLCIDQADEALVPEGVELVFRHKTREARKWIGPAWVCAKEQGTGAKVTCSSCRRCFTPGPLPRRKEAREGVAGTV